MLSFVVVVVIAFAHGEEGEEKRVARAAAAIKELSFAPLLAFVLATQRS
jgi:hypothetical protein